MENKVILGDCIDEMRKLPDGFFNLAIVDPPYGIGASNDHRFGMKQPQAASVRKSYTKKNWDESVPTVEYWDELFRVSKNQIVWGVNYFNDHRLCGGRIFWDKDVPDGYIKSRGEIAFKSFGISVDYVKITWHGMIQHDMRNKEHRIHPTQKPVALYEWLLRKYAKPGDKILDTHLGSGSSRIAALNLGFDFVGIEIDPEYFAAQEKRFNNCQLKLI